MFDDRSEKNTCGALPTHVLGCQIAALTMSDDESSDEEYNFAAEPDLDNKRFPLHDCCEFEDVESLKVR
jgi:hypothetical protein